MSDPILPLAVWQSGTNENSLPANDNALRLEALSRPCLGVENDAPTVISDGDVYLVGSAPTGDFAAFDENDITIYRAADPGPGGTWYAWAPVDGLRIVVADARKVFVGGSSDAWLDDPSVGGGGGGGAATVVTESTTSLDATSANAGNYTRFTNASAKTYTFDDGEAYAVGAEYHGRNVGAGLLAITVAGGMTINAPAGGTLNIPQGGTFTVKIVASDEADLFGITEAAP